MEDEVFVDDCAVDFDLYIDRTLLEKKHVGNLGMLFFKFLKRC